MINTMCNHCKCRHRAPGRKLCKPCLIARRGYQAHQRKSRIAKGLCIRCGRPAVPGIQMCEECRRKDLLKTTATQLRLTANRQCMICGCRLKPRDTRRCTACKDTARRRAQKTRARLRATRRCVECHKPLTKADGKGTQCRGCLKRIAQRRVAQRGQRKQEHLCIQCKAPLDAYLVFTHRVRCDHCRMLKAKKVQEKRDKKKWGL